MAHIGKELQLKNLLSKIFLFEFCNTINQFISRLKSIVKDEKNSIIDFPFSKLHSRDIEAFEGSLAIKILQFSIAAGSSYPVNTDLSQLTNKRKHKAVALNRSAKLLSTISPILLELEVYKRRYIGRFKLRSNPNNNNQQYCLSKPR